MLNPLNTVEFVTGFAVGTNLTGTTETLNLCQNTLSYDIITKGEIFGENIATIKPSLWFTGLYALWDVLFYSNQLVSSCTNLYDAIALNLREASQG